MEVFITNHAKRRFSERFSHLNDSIENILKKSQPHGIWTANTKVFACLEDGIVFIIGINKTKKTSALVTVVTLDQYTANAQQNFSMQIKLAEHEALAEVPEPEKEIKFKQEPKKQDKPMRENEIIVGELRELALKIAAERNYEFFEKEFFENNRWKEFGMSRKKFDIFYAEYCMICRKVHDFKI